MWVKLGSEYLNLNHLIRVRFIKTWNKEGECLVAEVETQVNGDVKQFIRYRNAEAEKLQEILAGQAAAAQLVPAGVVAGDSALLPAGALEDRQSSTPTMHDL